MRDSLELLDCGHPESAHSDFTSGYGTDAQGKRHCYACCAEQDKAHMREHGKICLYLTTTPDVLATVGSANRVPGYGNAKLTNWPGSLVLNGRYHKGRHNIAGSRYDVWFRFEGREWHGVQYGGNTQICHCRRLKGQP